MDEAVLDELPDDARHFIAIELYYGAFDLNLFHGVPFRHSLLPQSEYVREISLANISLYQDTFPSPRNTSYP